MMLTRDKIDECFSQPSASGFGKSRYDIAKEVEAAVLEKLKAQEPMCWMTPSGEGWMMRTEPPTIDTKLGWTALYEHPLPPDDVVRDLEAIASINEK